MIPMSLWGRAAGMGFSATQSATLLQEDLWLFCFVYLSVSILTVIWTADSLGPISLLLRVASAPCFLFGSFDSLNFHLSSLPLFLLLLMSHLTALGDQENRKPKSVCFLSHLPPPQRDVPVCFFKNELNIFMFYFSLSVETLGWIRSCWQSLSKEGSVCSFPGMIVTRTFMFLHTSIWEFVSQTHTTPVRCLF